MTEVYRATLSFHTKIKDNLCILLLFSLLLIDIAMQIKFQRIKSDKSQIEGEKSLSFQKSKKHSNESIQIDCACDNKPKFTEVFLSFPWEKYDYSLLNAPSLLVSEFMYNMSKFVGMEPKVPINETCYPPQLIPYENIKCENYPEGLTGKKRNCPLKAAHMINFGFDADILEIHLNELYQIVDKIFIIEQKAAHFKSTPKPLVWERIRFQPRFKKFNDKVVHLIMDDSDMAVNADNDIWQNERDQEIKRWEYFLDWNSKTKFFTEEDIVGFGDSDEIASMQAINLLKNCEFDGPVDIGIWFTQGVIHKKFRSDFPVKGHPYTLGDPTYFKIKDARKKKPYPTHMRGKSGRFLLGGTHMSRYHFLPFEILKTFSASEVNGKHIKNTIKKIVDDLKSGVSPTTIQYIERDKVMKFYERRMTDISYESFGKDEYILPWFLQCNLNRYPAFLSGTIPDKRIE